MKNRGQTQKGFTIIELLIVMAMISILSLIVAFRFTGTTAPFELDNARSVIAADVRTVVTWAQSGRIENSTQKVPYGYGIVFTQGTHAYILYADIDADHRYGGSASQDVIVNSLDLETDELIKNVTITECYPVINIEGVETCDLFVASPSGTIYTNGTRTANLEVYVEHQKTGKTAAVLLNSISGQLQ